MEFTEYQNYSLKYRDGSKYVTDEGYFLSTEFDKFSKEVRYLFFTSSGIKRIFSENLYSVKMKDNDPEIQEGIKEYGKNQKQIAKYKAKIEELERKNTNIRAKYETEPAFDVSDSVFAEPNNFLKQEIINEIEKRHCRLSMMNFGKRELIFSIYDNAYKQCLEVPVTFNTQIQIMAGSFMPAFEEKMADVPFRSLRHPDEIRKNANDISSYLFRIENTKDSEEIFEQSM